MLPRRAWPASRRPLTQTRPPVLPAGVYAPSVNNVKALSQYQASINSMTTAMMTTLSKGNAAFKLTATNATSQYWVGPAPDFVKVNGSIYNNTITSRQTALKNVQNYQKNVAYVLPQTMIYYLNATVVDYVQYSWLFFGQVRFSRFRRCGPGSAGACVGPGC